MESQKINPSEIEALDAELSFINENNIDAEAVIEDFRSALNFAISFPDRPASKRVIEIIRNRVEKLKPVELKIIAIAA